MAFNVVYKRSVGRDLKKLPKSAASGILDKIEDDLSKRADAYPALKEPFAGLRKLRIGDYRVIFALIGCDAIVLRIGHRREVYKKPIS